ncbi:tRNA (adenosine(37)-N6)-dimethylallyltransferase MiaA [Brevirhabdus pacifica]|uniref:tRNA dimethylallyltransferase n=1 Tax=Brevirhabdus pacifica TaxID=1267768 RepID=A0A1U7DLZ6_9RHOB|nr:tRNA (adenosine(37)-N6)-dimethylallyltransferase MiaA [Brevirhabdus pacifica]OWU80356.1 tRNA delta(2)-isopentenylpyrophosphate transferase [Loktanella sp. 22II-4b]
MLRDLPPDRPVLIAGPTASGKSALAARIVREGGGLIVNADALQVYGNWRLLTARPSAGEEAALPHRLYGHVAAGDSYSVGHWLREVAEILEGPNAPRPVVVGGTGLYFRALTEGLAPIPATPADLRAELDARLREEGVAALAAELVREDPATAGGIDLANPKRVQRALEVLRATGRGLRTWQDATPAPLLPIDRVLPIVLSPGRDALNARIDLRFDQMMDQGALEEARANLPGWDPAALSSRAIGAPELIAHLQGEIDLATAVARAKIATHQYAKRQRTWFRARMGNWHPVVPF